MAAIVTRGQRQPNIGDVLANVAGNFVAASGQRQQRQLQRDVADADIARNQSLTDKAIAEAARIRLGNDARRELGGNLSGVSTGVDGLTGEQLGNAVLASDKVDINSILNDLRDSQFKNRASSQFQSNPNQAAFTANLGGVKVDNQFSQNGAGQVLSNFGGQTDTSSALAQSNIAKNQAKNKAFTGIANQANANAEQIITGLGAAEEARKPLNSQDAKEIGKAREASDKAVQLENKLNQIDYLINDAKLDTGLLAPARALASNIGEAVGLGTGKTATLSQQFDSISKELGAETLALFGGSDTEKELEVALRTQPSLNRQEDANNLIIQRKVAAARILQQKPALQEAWLTENGSLSARNTQGQTFSDVWLSEQRRLGQEAGIIGGQLGGQSKEIGSREEYDELPQGAEYTYQGETYIKGQ